MSEGDPLGSEVTIPARKMTRRDPLGMGVTVLAGDAREGPPAMGTMPRLKREQPERGFGAGRDAKGTSGHSPEPMSPGDVTEP